MIGFWLQLELVNELTLLVTVAQAPRGRRYDRATSSGTLGQQQCDGRLCSRSWSGSRAAAYDSPRRGFYVIATPDAGVLRGRVNSRYAARR